ncbi:hypothetical protein Ait01nite_052960 [Actinoplanes italicus]|uniref:Uncharacterized protein n=1 Tax=Actinoplanes italicus TaxID=113567 RepID=A0A2T0JZN8_9ACTN|nr:hypothetical protein [Actinoplanes italicus]PRX15989.1 hypothetical protein CLV67_12136 [Actinoplanes italicus]GIE32251.1 hypothetical protein Ait01nite_052960 [Actinoplanes italicus]
MSSSQARIMVVVAALLAGIIAGIITGILAKADGCSILTAVLRGGGAVGATMALILGLVSSNVGILVASVDVLSALVVGLTTGWLSKADGSSPWAACLRGAVAFTSTIGLVLLVQHFLGVH